MLARAAANQPGKVCVFLQSCQPRSSSVLAALRSLTLSFPPLLHVLPCVQGTNIADMEGSPFHELGLKDIMDGVRVWLHGSFVVLVRYQQ